MPKFAGSIAVYPARALCLWYVGLIAVGALLLSQPFSAAAARPPITVLEACFTAASASCVTGLVVRSTPHDFNLFGQLVILVLIQLGGIGLMTVATFIAVNWTGKESLRDRAAAAETLGARRQVELFSVLKNVLVFTAFFEAAGFVVLLVRFLFETDPVSASWHALFHSISAFCNAGFALHDDSLSSFRSDPIVCLSIMFLIVIGGIGYPVMLDLHRNGAKPVDEGWRALTLHSKLTMIGTASLIAFGATALLALEGNNSLSGMGFGERILVAAFHSVSARTAGFNTVELSEMTDASLLIIILLMAIGAGACSTGGGFKVSTLVVLVLHSWRRLAGRRQVVAFRRSISSDTVERSIATVLLFIFIGVIALTLMLVAQSDKEPHAESSGEFLETTFEVASALGTVGLSVGHTTKLNVPGTLLVILLMFIGRVGPISMVVVLTRQSRASRLAFPEDEVLIG